MTLAQRVAMGLPGFAQLWLDFLVRWLNRPDDNVMAGPIARARGWGYIAGNRFDLGVGEALVFTMRSGGGRYTGVQMSDAWFITPDSRTVFTCGNGTQSEAGPGADGAI